MGRAIVVTSGKGGTGKTASAAALGCCLAQSGRRTLCIDCDVGLKNLDLALGLTDVSLTDFTDVISGRRTLREAAVPHPEIENLYFLSAPSSLQPEEIDPSGMTELILASREEYDFCLLDCPAGMGAGFRLAACGADEAIVVATVDASSLRDGQRIVALLEQEGIQEVRLLINKVKPWLLRYTGATLDDVIDSVGARLIGVVSEDDAVTLAGNLEVPLVLYDKDKKGAAAQFRRIARRLQGENVPIGKIS